MSDVVGIARAMMTVLGPITGTRAAGTATFVAEGADTTLPRNTYLVPIVGGARRYDLLCKVGPNPATQQPNGSGGDWTVTAAGTQVDVVSMVGGKRHNAIKRNTKLVIDEPRVAGIEDTAVAGAFTGAADPTEFASARSVVLYEDMGTPQVDLKLFSTVVKAFPAVVFVWTGSEPADGVTVSALNRGATRVGARRQLFKEQFDVMVVASRSDSDHHRRNEGLRLLDKVAEYLTDRMAVEGICISSPSGIQIRDRFRITGRSPAYQQLYIYAMRVAVTRVYRMVDTRTYNDWLLARIDATTQHEAGEGGPYTLVDDMDVDMSAP